MTRNFTTYVGQQGKVLSELTNEEIYVELLNFVKEEAAAKSKIALNVRYTIFQLSF